MAEEGVTTEGIIGHSEGEDIGMGWLRLVGSIKL